MKSLFTARFLSYLAFVALPLCGISESLFAQTSDSVSLKDYLPPDAESSYFTRFGVFGGANLVTQTPNFSAFGSIPAVGTSTYAAGTGIGIAAGALVEFPFSFSPSPERNVFGLSLRLSYATYNAKSSLTSNEIAYDKTTDQPTNVPIEYSLEGRFNFLSLEPTLTYRLANGRLSLYAGLRAGLTLSSTYSYTERVQDPRYVFLNGSTGQTGTTFGETNDKIPNAQVFNLAPTVGVGYEIPLNADGTIMLQPEGFWSPGLFSLASGFDWKISGFRVGASVKYSPFRTIRPEMTADVQEKILKLKRYDSLIVVERQQNAARLRYTDSVNKAISLRLEEMKKVGLSAAFKNIVGIDEQGREVPTPSLAIEEFRAWRSLPLLRAVYFEAGSSILPARYKRIQSASRARYVVPDVSEMQTVDAYRHVLNILGKRLNDFPNATIELIGHKSASETEALDERRAQTLSDYLQDVWRIAARRIAVRKAASAPTAKPESENYVEFTSDTPEVLEALTNDFTATSVNPPLLRIGLDINAGAGLKQWNLEISQFVENESVTLKEYMGTQAPPSIAEWNIADVQADKPRSNRDITVQLSVSDINNRSADAPINTIAVKLVSLEEKELRNAEDTRWEETLLIQSPLFGVNSRETLLATLKRNAGTAKSVTITTFTRDDKGRDAAVSRGKEVAGLLGRTDATIKVESALRPGQSTLTPEEAVYSQSAMVRMMTVMKK